MIYLKKINIKDVKEEYEILSNIPKEENGVKNDFFNISFDCFKNNVINTLINNSIGLDLSIGEVSNTIFFLWDNDKIVGLFKIRHYLSNCFENTHIGYYIDPKYRNMGYCTKGLKLALEEAKTIVSDDEIFMDTLKDNLASLKVQLNCGASLYKEDNLKYYTKIKIR